MKIHARFEEAMPTPQLPDSLVTKLLYSGAAGERLDKFLAGALPHLSRARVQVLIEQGQVLVNQHVATKAGARLVAGDEVSVTQAPKNPAAERPPASELEDAPERALEVVFEDEQLLVVNKPPGMAVHPAPRYSGPTVVETLLARSTPLAVVSVRSLEQLAERVPAPAEERWPGVVHRLDKDTSGLLLVAKTPQALMQLSQQFQARTITKRYLTLVEGVLPLQEGAIEAPIGRDQRQRHRMAVVARGGRQAQTLFWVEREVARFTLVRVQILTGRTHQIRVHFAAIGHPVVGDTLYGRQSSQSPQPLQPPRMFLHAMELRFIHPTTGQELAFAAPLPADLQGYLDMLSYR